MREKAEVKDMAGLPSLENLAMPKLEIWTDQGGKPKRTTVDFVYNGLTLNAKIFEKSSDRGLKEYKGITIEIRLGVGEGNIGNVSISFYYKIDGSGKLVAQTVVKNKNREIRGLGMALWERARRYIEEIAEYWNKNIIHVVNKYPEEGLLPEKWDELFLPCLEKHGYIKVGDDSWERIYQPR